MPRKSHISTTKPICTSKSEQGFSILEMVVSMTMFLMVTGSIWGTLQVAQQSRMVVNQEIQLSKSVRVALDLIGRDTYNAGYGYPLANTVVLPDNRVSTLLGIPNDFDTTRDTVPPIIAGNDITTNTFNTAAGVKTDQVTFLFKDSTFNASSGTSQPLKINAATTTGTGIDEIVPLSGSNLVCRVNDIYLVTGSTGSALGVVTALSGTSTIQFANGDLLGFNQTGPSGQLRGITVPASIQRVKMVTYFVTANGILTRREYANVAPPPAAPAFVDNPLVYGVENFQIRYVMDDGTVSDNPSAGPDGTAGTADDEQVRLAAVRQVRFTVSIRSTEVDAKGKPFRLTMTSTFSTRNLGYDAS